MQVEIIGTDGKVHYTRPHEHPDVLEALKTPGYTVRGANERGEPPVRVQPVVSRRFPIMHGWQGGAVTRRDSIPWELIAPHEAQAQRNHGGQTLQRLAERGGLDAMEAVAVIEDTDYRNMWPDSIGDRASLNALSTKAINRLEELCAAFASANDGAMPRRQTE